MNMSTNISDLPDALHEEEQMMYEQPEMEMGMPMEQEYEESEMEFEEQEQEQVEEFGNLGEYSIVKAVRAELTLNNLVVFLALVLAALPQVAGLAVQGLTTVGLTRVLPATQFNAPVVIGLVLMIILILARRFLL